MAEKIGAGNKPQNYDEKTGEYADTDFFTGEVKNTESHEDFFKEPEKPKLAIEGEQAEKLYNDISNGKLYDTEQLREHPVVKELDNLAEEYNKKYGVTADIKTPEREKMRKQWEEDFLSAGSMTQVGKDEKGRPVYEPKGKIRKEHKAVVVIGLPAAGKSTAVANPVSEQNGAFIFDSDEIKGYIPEFKESNGGAANAVHKESKQILKSAFSKFLDGGERNGENLVIPIIGDDIGNRENGKGVLGKWVEPLEKSGYDVEIKFKDADPKESMNRVFMRAIKTGRVIPSKVVLDYGDKPRGVFEEFKKLKNGKGEPYVR